VSENNPSSKKRIEFLGNGPLCSLGAVPLLRYVNQMLVAWAMRKFKRFKDHKIRTSQFLQRLGAERRDLFLHWDIGMTGVFA
jgi:RNA-directed DNA polymerase